MPLDGQLDRAILTAVETEGVHVVGLQLPAGTKGVPGNVLGLLRSCKGAVLLYKDTS